MRKNVFGRRFKRDKNERRAMFKSLMSSLVLNGRIKTTEAKAKAIKGEVDKLITKARKEALLAKRLLEQKLHPQAIEKLLKEIAPRFSKRQGGYTRIIKLERRVGDNAQAVIMEWVEGENLPAVQEVKKEPVRKEEKKAVKPVKAKKAVVKKEVKKVAKKTKK